VSLERDPDGADQGGIVEWLDEIGRCADPGNTLAIPRIVAPGHEDRGNGQSHPGQPVMEIQAAHLTEMDIEHQDRTVELSGL